MTSVPNGSSVRFECAADHRGRPVGAQTANQAQGRRHAGADPRGSQGQRPLAARKAQGAQLGNRCNAAEAAALGRQVQAEEAAAFAANVLPIIESLRPSGVRDMRGLAAALNNRGVRTARGGRWHASNVKNPVDDDTLTRQVPGERLPRWPTALERANLTSPDGVPSPLPAHPRLRPPLGPRAEALSARVAGPCVPIGCHGVNAGGNVTRIPTRPGTAPRGVEKVTLCIWLEHRSRPW